MITRAYLRVRLEGRERLPPGPAIYCFNHLSWSDPFVLMAILPFRPRLYFFGPKEEDMGVGGRNRLMSWTGTAIPYRPGKNDLLDATRRVGAVLAAGGVVAIAGEGRIHARESRAPAAQEGAGLLRAPLAACRSSRSRSAARAGCGSAGGSRVRVGEPHRRRRAGRRGRPSTTLTARCWQRSTRLVADAPGRPGAGPRRPLADRALQRLAGGVARGRPARPSPRRRGLAILGAVDPSE